MERIKLHKINLNSSCWSFDNKPYDKTQVAGANRDREDVLPAGFGQGSDEDDWKTTLFSPLQGALSI